MSFILRIFFAGLIAFVPNGDSDELVVLLVEAQNESMASDGNPIPVHEPLLLAQAGSCEGDCRQNVQEIADFIFQGVRRPNPASALDQLSASLRGGGSWSLHDSELSILTERTNDARPKLSIRGSNNTGTRRSGQQVPKTVREREEFSWVAEIGKIDPSVTRVDPDVLAVQPKKGLIVARLTLDSGEVMSYRLTSVQGRVVPIEFRSLREGAPATQYQQALADWVVAEVPIQGCEVELVDRHFSSGETRRMKLSPKDCDGGVVEVALLNVPASMFNPPPRRASDGPPEPGRHFERFYDLAQGLQPHHPRPVPYAPTLASKAKGGVLWTNLHPKEVRRSPLLEGVGLADPRGPIDRVICPVVQFSDSAESSSSLD